MFRRAFTVLILTCGAAHGAPNEDHWGSPPSEEYAHAADLVASSKFNEALPILQSLAEKSPGDADVFNLLGFSYRKIGDLTLAAAHYQRALRLNPDHRGALEYQGELFLMQGDVASAEANLAKLAMLCPGGCEERDELAEAVVKWKAAQN